MSYVLQFFIAAVATVTFAILFASYPKISSTVFSLNSATSLTVFNEANPCIVALTMLIGVLEPIHLDKISR